MFEGFYHPWCLTMTYPEYCSGDQYWVGLMQAVLYRTQACTHHNWGGRPITSFLHLFLEELFQPSQLYRISSPLIAVPVVCLQKS